MPIVRLVVTGRVQGVGFRAFVYDLAQAMGVTGAVWNTRQGSVEVVVGHNLSGVLDEFVERVGRGPGYVDKVSRFEENGNLPESGFEIRPTV